MTYSAINIGTTPNDGTGDPIRTAFDKVNSGLISVDNQEYFNTRLFTSNIVNGNVITYGNAVISEFLTAGNTTVGNLIVPPGGKIYGVYSGTIGVGDLDDTTIGLAVPAAAGFTDVTIANLTVTANANVSQIYVTANATVSNLTVSGQVLENMYFVGKTVYVDGSPVQTAAQAFTGGNVSQPTRILSLVDSTSPTSGALRTDGGLGVNLHAYIGQDLTVVHSINAEALNATSNIVVGTASNVALFGGNNAIKGTLITAAQPNITSVGSLSSLSMGGNITAGLSNTYTIGDVSAPFIDIYGFRINSTFLTGTLQTAAQTNITSVGSLLSLDVTGNISSANLVTGNVRATGTITTVGNIASANVTTGNINAAGTITSANEATGNITITGNITTTANVTGNVTSANVVTGNIVVTGISTVTGNVTSANVTTGNINSSATITATTVTTTGNISTSTLANVITGNVFLLGNITSTSTYSNISVANVNLTGMANIAGAIYGVSNGIVQPQQFFRLNTALVRADQIAAQSVFGQSVNVLASTVYEFEGVYAFSKSAGTTSGTLSLSFGGTRTLSDISYTVYASINTLNFASSITTVNSFVQTSSGTNIVTISSSATSFMTVMFKGTVSISGAGTFIPQFSPGAVLGGPLTLAAGSYFKMTPLTASGANVRVGSWNSI